MTPTPEEMTRLAAFPSPGLRGVLIQGVDGGWGDENGSSRGLSGPADLLWLLANRAVADAILVSADTAVRENYRPIALRPEFVHARESLGLHGVPLLVIVTRTPAKVARALEIADLVVTCGEPSDDERVLVAGGETIDWPAAVARLNERGLVRLVCEGGPQLIDALISARCLDQLALTTSPMAANTVNSCEALRDFVSTSKAQPLFETDGFSFAMLGSIPSWEERLSRQELFVLRHHGTEPAFSAEYEKKPAPGYYVCRACGNRLFDASDQFDARCGWPAFWQPSSGDKVKLIEDRSLGMRRVEVRCAACESHLGHVFHGEGFGYPTDDRYCINAICLERRY